MAINNLTNIQLLLSKVAKNKSCLPININSAETPKYVLSMNNANDAIASGINSGGLSFLDLEVAIIILVSCSNTVPQDITDII